MGEHSFFQEQAKYDYLQFVTPDINNLPRGKILKGKFKEQAAREGFEVPCVICYRGHGPDIPQSLSQLLGTQLPNVRMQPCLETLTPWPWVGGQDRRVGNVICDVVMLDGTPDLTSPRQMMKAQLDALREQHGLVLKSAFEYEFNVFKAATLEPLGGSHQLPLDVCRWGQHHDLFCDFTDLLEVMGIQVESLMTECLPGSWEITMEPQEGVRGGDVGFYVKNGLREFFRARGYQASFMSSPTVEHTDTMLNLNHSLWAKKGSTTTNAMLDTSDPDLLSSTARHWLAGILHHSPALTALCAPTLNCYRRFLHSSVPSPICWGVDDRDTVVRVRNACNNVFFENRLPTGPCNPYIAIAGTVAAGLDGINRQLPCPAPRDADQHCHIPNTLPEALDALEKDEQLRSLLGSRFVDCYVNSKREYDLRLFDASVLDTEEKQLEFDRELYMEKLKL